MSTVEVFADLLVGRGSLDVGATSDVVEFRKCDPETISKWIGSMS